MFARLKRTAFSLIAVIAAFGVYRFTVVPFIDPPRQIKRVSAPSRNDVQASRLPQNHLGGYARFFPEGSWERDNPIILQSETSRLLLKEYTTLPDGQLKLTPCTVIYTPNGDAEAADSHNRVIILQAPEGAVLKFDQAVDLARGKIGRLQGGAMAGPVVIQSGATKPGGGDDLFALTRDVKMQDNLIFTSADVDFRFGSSNGHGREMRIELLPSPPGNNSHGANFGGVQSFQLLTEVRMHLQPGSGGFLPGDQNAASRPASSASTTTFTPSGGTAMSDSNNNAPVDIRCQGPFEFDLVQNVATFHDKVDVVRPRSVGASDQINGELLKLYFTPRQDPAATTPKTADANSDASAKSAADAKDKSATKTAKNSAGGMPQLEPSRLVVRGNPVVVRAESIGGEIRGQRLEYEIAARHLVMEASGSSVQIASPQLSGEVSLLEVWTRDEQQSGSSPVAAQSRTPPAQNTNPLQSSGPNTPSQHYEIYGSALRVWSASSRAGNDVERIVVDGNVRFAQSETQSGEKPLETKGDYLEVTHANSPNAEVAITGRPAEISAQGLTMIGQTVHLNRGQNRLWIDGSGHMTITGNPTAQAQPNAVDPADPRGGTLFSSGRGTTTVDWSGGMVFDGRTVKFDRDVVGQHVDGETTQTVRAPQVDVTLQQRVDFNAVGPQRQQIRPQVETLTCRGDVWLENRQNENGALINLDRVEHLSTLSLNQLSGELSGHASAEQPGHMYNWRLGSPAAISSGMNGLSSTADTANPTPSNRSQINYLDVQFQNSLTGNILPARQELTFHDGIRCVYGPVPTWEAQLDADSPTGLPAGCMLMTCDQLTTSQAAARGQPRGAMEMEALGNTRVDGQRPEGDSFSALAQRITYSQAKDMLVLVGDGRNDAQLFRQEQPAAPQTRTAAGSIYYWPSTRQVKVGDLKFVDSTQYGNKPQPRTPPGSRTAPASSPKPAAANSFTNPSR